jgi:SPP1 family predicted phage head-tail adaptor
MTNVAAGRLRHRIRIDEQVTLKNSFGEQTTEWEEVATVWAAIEPLSARESMIAGQTQSKVSARLVIRARSDIMASMRAVHVKTGTIYNIEGVIRDPDSGLEWITLPVSQGTNDG